MRHFQRPDLKAAASPALVARGCVNVIGLETLRDRAGSRWEKMRSGVYARLETILRQRLGTADFFIPLDEVTYLVTTPAADGEDAQIACLRAAYDLHVGYLGRCDFDSLNLYRAAQADGDSIVIEKIAIDRLRALAERAGAGDATVKQHAPNNRSCAPEPAEPPVAEYKVQFVPMWDARNEAISLYVCAPQRVPFGPGSYLTLSPCDLPVKLRAKVEISCLQQGIAVLNRHLQRGERFLMGIGVGYETLSSHIARVEFTSACRELLADFRQYLVFQLTDVPLGVPHTRLADLVLAVKPYARAVMSEVPISCRNFADYQGIGLQAVGLNLERSKASRKEMAEEIARFAAAARRFSFSTYLSGVSNLAALRAARQGNVHYMTGPTIAPTGAEPGPMRRLHWDEVMRGTVASNAFA